MRLPLAVALLVLLAGCSDSPSAAPVADGSPDTSDATDGLVQAPDGEQVPTGLELLAFGVADQELAMAAEGTFAVGQQCFLFFAGLCDGLQRVDLTSVVPTGAPTQVVVHVDHDGGPGTGLDVSFEIEGGSLSRYDVAEDEEGNDETVVVVALQPGGTVTAVLQLFIPSFLPPQETHYTLEARGVVRSSVLPTYLPVGVELGPGESLAADGEGLEDLIIVPPGGSPIHHLGPFVYNASADVPRGRHIVVAKGEADITLHGPAGRRLTVLPILQQVGQPHALASGQPIDWDFTVPGVPLYVGLRVENQDQAGGFAVAPFHGNFEMTLQREGADLLTVAEDDCLTPCQFSLLSSGYTNYWGEYLDEKLGGGNYHAAARFDTSNGYQVRDLVTYIAG